MKKDEDYCTDVASCCPMEELRSSSMNKKMCDLLLADLTPSPRGQSHKLIVSHKGTMRGSYS